jgi:hypothetical protein
MKKEKNQEEDVKASGDRSRKYSRRHYDSTFLPSQIHLIAAISNP